MDTNDQIATIAKPSATALYSEWEKVIYTALQSYSNVHRGSGHFSMATTHLYEKAREVVLDYLGLDGKQYSVIFCSALRAAGLESLFESKEYKKLTSRELEIPLGVTALAIRKKALKNNQPRQTGGGTTKIVSTEWIVWAEAPDLYEAGTPAIINVIAFAKALQLIRKTGKNLFQEMDTKDVSVEEILYHDKLEDLSGIELLDALRKTLIGKDMRVPTSQGLKRYINLDNGASTPSFEFVWECVRKSWKQDKERQQAMVAEVRKIIARVLQAPSEKYDIHFTSNTTEAINLVAENILLENEDEHEQVILGSMLEHSSNDLPWRLLPGADFLRLSVDNKGFYKLDELEKLLSDYNQDHKHGNKRIKLVCLSGCSNVLGSYNDLEKISQIVHSFGARLLIDAAQVIAHRKLDVSKTGIDYLAFCAHKAYAPFGTGVLLMKKELTHFSKDQLDLIRASGEENAGGISGLGKALLLLERIGFDLIQQEEQALTRMLLQDLARVPKIKMYGLTNPADRAFERKGGVVLFELNKMMPAKLARKLAQQGGIGVRYGCHCAHIIIKQLLNIKPPLENLQKYIIKVFPHLKFQGMVRVSLGIENTKQDIEELIKVLERIASKEEEKKSSINVKKDTEDFVEKTGNTVFSIF